MAPSPVKHYSIIEDFRLKIVLILITIVLYLTYNYETIFPTNYNEDVPYSAVNNELVFLGYVVVGLIWFLVSLTSYLIRSSTTIFKRSFILKQRVD